MAANTADDAYHELIFRLNRFYKKHFPYQEVKETKKPQKPWITLELLHKIKIKNMLFQNSFKTKAIPLLITYKKYRNSLNSELAKGKEKFFSLKCSIRTY